MKDYLKGTLAEFIDDIRSMPEDYLWFAGTVIGMVGWALLILVFICVL